MAYSDYGGYGYRNGERIEERSDAVLTTEGLKSTPGAWPGFLIPEGRGGGGFHVILGDGPVHVGLYKQSTVVAHVDGNDVDFDALLMQEYPQFVREYEIKGENGRYFDSHAAEEEGVTVSITVANHKIEAHWVEDDNFYLYVRLTQPDGVIWTGWSGYGVGAGLEGCDYGFSTFDREYLAKMHWETLDGTA